MMQLTKTIKIKLNPTNKKKDKLDAMMSESSKCMNYIIDTLWELETIQGNTIYPSAFTLSKLFSYKDSEHSLRNISKIQKSAMFEGITAKVHPVYKNYFKKGVSVPKFKPKVVPYRTRAVRFKNGHVRIPVLDGWAYVPYDDTYKEEIEYLINERNNEFTCEVVKSNDAYYLHTVINKEIEVPDPATCKTPVGIDLGIVNIATVGALIDGKPTNIKFYSGKELVHRQKLFQKTREKKQTGNKRRMKKGGEKEGRTINWFLHNISRDIVNKVSQLDKPTIFMEKLTGLRENLELKKWGDGGKTKGWRSRRYNYMLSNWAYKRLQKMIEYKGNWLGIPTVYVEARGTSSTCPQCGSKEVIRDRKRHSLKCKECNYEVNDDWAGFVNIAKRGMEACGLAV